MKLCVRKQREEMILAFFVGEALVSGQERAANLGAGIRHDDQIRAECGWRG